MKKLSRNQLRQKRHLRVRRKVSGTSVRPRLNVFRSNQGLFVQLIDDVLGKTLVSVSYLEKGLGSNLAGLSGNKRASEIGKILAQRALDKDISKVVFDRGGYKYHGQVESVAQAARDGGLEF